MCFQHQSYAICLTSQPCGPHVGFRSQKRSAMQSILTTPFSLLFFKPYVKPFGTILNGFYLSWAHDHVNTKESSLYSPNFVLNPGKSLAPRYRTISFKSFCLSAVPPSLSVTPCLAQGGAPYWTTEPRSCIILGAFNQSFVLFHKDGEVSVVNFQRLLSGIRSSSWKCPYRASPVPTERQRERKIAGSEELPSSGGDRSP